MERRVMPTEACLIAAERFTNEMREAPYRGDVPYAVIDAQGKIMFNGRSAACLGSFYSRYDGNREPLEKSTFLFQWVKTSEYNGFKDDDFTFTYLEYLLNKSSFRDDFVPFSHDEYMRYGVAFHITDCPTNMPLVLSTHARYMWDSHNDRTAELFHTLWKQGYGSIEECMMVSFLIRDIRSDNLYVRAWDSAHSPFGDRLTIEMAQMYLKNEPFDKWWDKRKLDWCSPIHGLGVTNFFRQSGTYINECLSDWLMDVSGRKNNYGTVTFEKKKAYPEILTILKEKLHA